MNSTPQSRMSGPWKELQSSLAGSLTARSRGFLGNELVLSDSAEREQGRLKIPGFQGAELIAEGLEAVVERAADSRYTMRSGGEEVLTARPSGTSADSLAIGCGNQTYTASISLLRNTAVARNRAGGEAVRLSGGITGRSFKVEMDVEDVCALPVAVLVLYHMASSRRHAYRTATGRE